MVEMVEMEMGYSCTFEGCDDDYVYHNMQGLRMHQKEKHGIPFPAPRTAYDTYEADPPTLPDKDDWVGKHNWEYLASPNVRVSVFTMHSYIGTFTSSIGTGFSWYDWWRAGWLEPALEESEGGEIKFKLTDKGREAISLGMGKEKGADDEGGR